MFRSWFQEAAREEHVNAIYWLLQPLDADWHTLVQEVLNALRQGARVSDAGDMLAAGLKAWRDALTDERVVTEKKLKGEVEFLREKSTRLEQENRQLKADMKQIETENSKLQEQCAEQETSIRKMKRTIASQNDVLAEQHYKLANIFGNSNNSTPA